MQKPADNRPASERFLFRLPGARVSDLVEAMIKGRRVRRLGDEFKPRPQAQAKPSRKRPPLSGKPIGRPKAAKSGAFMLEGILVFHGTPCRKAGHTLRYAKNGNCLECTRGGDRDESRGQTYEGPPCKKKGHTTRYVNGGACVQCMKSKGR